MSNKINWWTHLISITMEVKHNFIFIFVYHACLFLSATSKWSTTTRFHNLSAFHLFFLVLNANTPTSNTRKKLEIIPLVLHWVASGTHKFEERRERCYGNLLVSFKTMHKHRIRWLYLWWSDLFREWFLFEDLCLMLWAWWFGSYIGPIFYTKI